MQQKEAPLSFSQASSNGGAGRCRLPAMDVRPSGPAMEVHNLSSEVQR